MEDFTELDSDRSRLRLAIKNFNKQWKKSMTIGTIMEAYQMLRMNSSLLSSIHTLLLKTSPLTPSLYTSSKMNSHLTLSIIFMVK